MAHEADVAVVAIRRSQLDPSNASYESPPPNWRKALVSLARKRVTALQTFADRLEGESATLPEIPGRESAPEDTELGYLEPLDGPERNGP